MGLGLLSLEQNSLGEILSMCIVVYGGESKISGARLFLVVLSNRTKGSGYKLKHRKTLFPLCR